MRWQQLAAFLPACIGLIVAALIDRGVLLYRIVDFKNINLVWLAALIGLVLSGLAAAVMAARGRVEGVYGQLADDRQRFLRRLNHELRNRLTAVRTGIDRLEAAPTEDDRPEALKNIKGEVERLNQLATGLAKLAEVERCNIEHASVNIAELLKEIEEEARLVAGARKLKFPEITWLLPNISGDRDLLFLALHNLLDNALKFTQPEDTVEVMASAEEKHVVIRIADTGPGISEEERPHVWNELYRGKATQAVPGSGLGLALVRAIVRCHNGEVALDSRVQDEQPTATAGDVEHLAKRIRHGTLVTIRLPVGRSIEQGNPDSRT